MSEEQPVVTTGQPASEPGLALAPLLERLAQLGADLTRAGEVADMTYRQVALIPGQVRALSTKVDGLASTISESRYQALLLRLLALYDLTGQLTPSDPAAPEYHPLDVLRTQMRQVLEVNGLYEIAAEGKFDPAQQRSLGSIVTGDAAQDGQVLEVVRPGFRSDSGILRYAEVRVGKFTPPAAGRVGSEG